MMSELNSSSSLLPKRPRGRPTALALIQYQEQVDRFCRLILEIRSTMDFKVGARGWCYVLERHGLRKGDFDEAEKQINKCRKSGDLPIDICAEDDSRATIGIEQLDPRDIPDEVEAWVNHLRASNWTIPNTPIITKIMSRTTLPSLELENVKPMPWLSSPKSVGSYVVTPSWNICRPMEPIYRPGGGKMSVPFIDSIGFGTWDTALLQAHQLRELTTIPRAHQSRAHHHSPEDYSRWKIVNTRKMRQGPVRDCR